MKVVKVAIPQGRYVMAVSGGVDSMTLLDLLAKKSGLELTVAHFNHGIRPEAGKDEELVRKAAKGYQLPYKVGYGKLGPGASEEKAREARYKFLGEVKKVHRADKIVTAHHQDDLVETAILNILRGSGRRGLTAIRNNPDILRPLLDVPKKEILEYAKTRNLKWREDPTNNDESYLRNYTRLKIIPMLSEKQKQQLLSDLSKMATTNQAIDQGIAKISQKIVKNTKIDRSKFINLPTEVAREVLMHFLRQNHIRDYDERLIDRLVTAIKTARPNTRHDVTRGRALEVTASSAHLATPD